MEKEFSFDPVGVCARHMNVVYEDGIIKKVTIIAGCPGNTQGVSRLVEGMSIEEAIKRLDGIKCRNGTSCPDQLAQGLKRILRNEQK